MLSRLVTTLPSLRGTARVAARRPAPLWRAMSDESNVNASAEQSISVSAGGPKDMVKRVEISERCIARLQHLQEKRDRNTVLRVTVDAGGCSGFQYQFNLEEWTAKDEAERADDENDVILEKDGVKVVVDRITLEYINGATVDYVEEMISSSFRIADNPNSEAACGCGVSFSPKL